jgi:hypothetical protein
MQVIPYHLESMAFGVELDGSEDFFQMFWPTIISHKIGAARRENCAKCDIAIAFTSYLHGQAKGAKMIIYLT